MKKRRISVAQSSRPLIVVVVFVLTLFVAGMRLAQAQANPSPTPAPDLIQAQTEYYKAQTTKTNEERGLWQRVVSLGPLFGAFFVAMVALISFIFNYRATLQGQRDTQFYEALKRFGDKDSPRLRSSAAGTLAQMGRRKVGRVKGLLPLNRIQPYFGTALDQLITGLRLEENPVVLTSIDNALQQLIVNDPQRAIEHLHQANIRLRDELRDTLVEFFVAMGVKDEETITDELWQQAASGTPYEDKVLRGLFEQFNNLIPRRFRAALRAYEAVNDKIRYRQKTLETVRVTAKHLSENIKLCGRTFRAFPKTGLLQKLLLILNARSGPDCRAMFLPNADLTAAELPGINFLFADLQHAHLDGARLTGANLMFTNLTHTTLYETKLRRANLKGARLHGAHVGIVRGMAQGARWWRANFFAGRGVENLAVDEELLETLYSRYRKGMPEDSRKLHESVRVFLKTKKPSAVQEARDEN